MKKPALVIVAIVAALLAMAWGGGWLDAFTKPEAIQAAVIRAGMWGPLLFFALALGMFSAFVLAPLVWASTAIWPLPVAFSYSFAAALLASVLTFVVASRLGGDWAQERVPASIQRWEERMRAHPFWTIIALRLLLWANPLIDLFAAVSRVPTRTYVLASAVGMLPPTVFQVMLGAGGIKIAGQLPWWGWAMAATVALVGVIAFRALRSRRASA